ncbi:MAG: hypothetical protein H6Q13_1071 [Bacteroidetes bacterium]|nr:hypothetical protein [Bacteroidota bacterium]
MQYNIIYLCAMLYYRRKLLLAVLEAFGGTLTSKMLQKYLFLITRGQEAKSFDFVPFKYGCFSFQANQDLQTLVTLGYLENATIDASSGYTLKSGVSTLKELDMFDKQQIFSVWNEFGHYTQDELIKYVYIKAPFYAINSVIAERLLSSEELAKVAAQRRHIDEHRLFTIGYEGISLEAYITQLILKDIRVLCDVRKNAYSRKFGFSKVQLQKACLGVGIKYIHIPELGIESEKRKELKTQADYNELFDEYEATSLKENSQYLNIIVGLLSSEGRVALTCFEKSPLMCHRSRVARAVLSLPEVDVPLTNI